MSRAHLVGMLALTCVQLTACGGSATTPTSTASGARNANAPLAVLLMRSVPSFEGEIAAAPLLRAPPAEESSAERAADALERARTRYRDLRFDQSLAAVGEAQVLLERTARTAEDFDALHAALLYRAMNELGLGNEDEAREALRDAIGIRPHATLDEGRFPPPVRELHASVHAAVLAETPRAMAVTTVPAGARVYVDGRPAGTSPVSVHVSRGRHILRVEAIGHAPKVLTVELRAADTPPLRVELGPADAEQLASQLARLPPDAFESFSERDRTQIAASLGHARLARVSLQNGTLRGISVDLQTGVLRRESVRGAEPREGVRILIERLEAGSPGQPGSGSGGQVPTWAWIAGGVAVAAGLTAGILIATQEPDPVLVLTPNP